MALPKESAELGCRVFSTVRASDYVFQPGVLYSCEHTILNDLHLIERRWQLYRTPSVASDLIIQTGHEGEFLYRRQRVPLYYRRAFEHNYRGSISNYWKNRYAIDVSRHSSIACLT